MALGGSAAREHPVEQEEAENREKRREGEPEMIGVKVFV